MTKSSVNFNPNSSPVRPVTAGDVELMIAESQANVEADISVVSEQLADTGMQMGKQKYYVSISEFPRIVPENEDGARWQRAIDSLPNGGVVIGEVSEYITTLTITVKPNVTILGQGNGRFHKGTSFKYGGTGAAFNFANSTAGVKLINFKVYTGDSSTNKKNFTGIDVNRGELVTIQDVTIENANIGIDCSGSLGPIYLLKIDNIFIWGSNKGIYVRSSGSWKNGIYIGVGDISDNGIGIHGEIGEGNIIEGKASELGRNTTAGIKLDGGMWTVKGALWMEQNAIGFHITGGNHTFDGDVRNIDPITVTGGTLISSSRQSYVEPVFKGVTDKDLAYWYSFDEGSGKDVYDRANGLKATYDIAPLWNQEKGYFRNTATTQAANKLAIPMSAVDWSQDWTMMVLGKGVETSNAFIVKGSDNTKLLFFRYYKDGFQLWDNVNFQTNLRTYPGVDLRQTSQWVTLSYNATTKKLTSYTNSGKIVNEFTYDISTVFNAPLFAYLAYPDVSLDEFLVYKRILEPTEIAAITNLKTLPNFSKKGDNQTILKSPDGSRWKQSIDNAGAVTWNKL